MWLTTIVVNNRFSDRFAGTFCIIIFLFLGFCYYFIIVCCQCSLNCIKKKFIQIADLTTACFNIQDKNAPAKQQFRKCKS